MKKLMVVFGIIVVLSVLLLPTAALAADKDGIVDSVGDTRVLLNAGDPGAVADAIAAWKLANPGASYGQAIKAFNEFLHGK
jgi:hypothetical protein